MARGKLWEEWEDNVLRELYPQYGWAACQRKLPHRSRGGIIHRATTPLRLSYRFATNIGTPRTVSYEPIPAPNDTRDLTARIFGDPLPGRSALDMRGDA